jgi:hypothetical protein
MSASGTIMTNTDIKKLEAIVDEWLAKLASNTEADTGTSIGALLSMSVGRVIKAELTKIGEEVNEYRWRLHIEEKYRNNTHHIKDWLVGAVLRNEPWLDRVNPEGVPLKLAKSGRFDQIVNEANKAMRRLNSRGTDVAIESNVVHEFGNGYVIVQLKTPAELQAESSMMQHCVGHGAYHGAVEADTTRIFSLRDRYGKAHATIEVNVRNLTVEQVKGKQNDIPRTDYFEMVAEWLNLGSYEFDCGDYPPGFAIDNNRKIVNVSKLKDGGEFDGDLIIELSDGTTPSLPRDLIVTGSLSVRAPNINTGYAKFKFPKGLVVCKDLFLRGLRIDQEEPFPGRALYLDWCAIERMPPYVEQTTTIKNSRVVGAFVKGVVFERLVAISQLLKMSRLLKHATFMNNLNLDYASEIPDGLKVAGDLKITRSSAVFFDGSVEVGQSLVINDSRIEGDPNRLRIGTTLHVHRSKMRMLPNDTVIGTDLVLSSVEDFRELPKAVQVGGSIRIDDTEICSLDGRQEFNELTLNRTQVSELPQGMVVRGDLTITNTPIMALPDDLVVQDGNLDVRNTRIDSVPATLSVTGNADFRGTLINSIPASTYIGGEISMEDHVVLDVLDAGPKAVGCNFG